MEVQKLYSDSSPGCGDGMCRLGAQRQPSSDDARSFADAYEKGERGEGKQDRQGAQDGERQSSQTMPSPASLMESLFSGRMQETPQVAAPEAAPATDMGEAMDKLVERILVAEPAQGAQEVRITLGDGMLKGAELPRRLRPAANMCRSWWTGVMPGAAMRAIPGSVRRAYSPWMNRRAHDRAIPRHSPVTRRGAPLERPSLPPAAHRRHAGQRSAVHAGG